MAEQQTINIVNGVHIDPLKDTISAIRKDPDLANSKFHIHNRWLGGTHNRGIVSEFYAANCTIPHTQTFTLDAGEPDLLGGEDQAPNPVEHLLNALAACLTNSLICHATVNEIPIEELECDVYGEIDINGFLGLSENIRKGFKNITVKFKINTDEPSTEKLLEFAKYSPVFDTVLNGTPVEVKIEKK